MSDASWHERNNAYLAAELELLRLRLLRLEHAEAPARETAAPVEVVPHAPAAPPAPVPVPVHPPAPAPARRRFRKAPPAVPPPAAPMPARAPAAVAQPRMDASAPSDEEVAQAIERRDAAAAMEGGPALDMLSRQLGLSPFERDTLLLCAAMELAPGLGALCAKAQGHAALSHPTFGLALSLFDDPTWDAVSADRPLRYARLVEISQPGALPLTSSPLRADERIVNYLKGRNVLDDRLSAFLEPAADAAGWSLAPSQQDVMERVLRRLHLSSHDPVVPVVQLVGVDADTRLALAVHVAAALSRRLYRLRLESLPSEVAEIELFARLWERESLLLPIALYVDAASAETLPADATRALHRLLAHRLGLAFLGVREGSLALSAPNFAVKVLKPTREEQRLAWAAQLDADATGEDADATGEDADATDDYPDATDDYPDATDENAAPTAKEGAGETDMASVLAGQFDLSVGEIQEAARMAVGGPDEPRPLAERLWAACRELTRPRLDSLAQHLEAKATWDDLVLPEESMSLLHQIAGQVRQRHKVYESWGFAQRMNRGFGISALFAGESGTGKTMAAEVIANELALNLYRIDLSAVVSKYIGETEKNLARLFDAAEMGGAILLFDEADALFGKRGEVKDSHDRYANIEINYLLQRIEAFTGLAILTTNMKTAVDAAFMRRLRFIVNFQFPGIPERELMWQRALPPQTPVADLDFTRLARLTLTGGSIHNIALNAAFKAAENGQTVTMPALLTAARMELRKLDKPFNEAELR
ncbi:MAG: hypothetical protein QOH83_2098 [Solirubrobacteraceae bacterium]|nr:hypothetical protein [Solirubrobacteraceae bacterium]